ncbi:MAG: hypothetical protein KF704_12395 [Crocinitomicaceae bacterium]|nr:hypothetical protein [Crocinitomicaceae bacterium]
MENETGLRLFFWLGTFIMLALTFAVLLITVMYQKKVHKMKQKESENLLQTSLDSEKKERKRIASDLHDGVCGDISAVRNYIAILNKKEQDPYNKSILEEVNETLNNTLNNIQEISYNLMPPLLESSGLIPTLNEYFDRVKKWSNVSITTQYYTTDVPISSSEVYELYRIVQEFIHNMLKHGNVTQIHFSIRSVKSLLIFEITDDGASFDFYKNMENTSGMGLKNIASRSRKIGAILKQIPNEKGNNIEIHLKK